jgi:hypothetical protein
MEYLFYINKKYQGGEDRTMTDTKYGQYILRGPAKQIGPQPGKTSSGIVVNAESWPGVSGIECNFAFICVSEPCLMPDPPHKHDFDEFLYFFPTDPTDMNNLGAVVEIALGEEWEKHVIETSFVLYLPKGLQHCPLNIKKVDRPFYFGHIMMTPKYVKV